MGSSRPKLPVFVIVVIICVILAIILILMLVFREWLRRQLQTLRARYWVKRGQPEEDRNNIAPDTQENGWDNLGMDNMGQTEGGGFEEYQPSGRTGQVWTVSNGSRQYDDRTPGRRIQLDSQHLNPPPYDDITEDQMKQARLQDYLHTAPATQPYNGIDGATYPPAYESVQTIGQAEMGMGFMESYMGPNMARTTQQNGMARSDIQNGRPIKQTIHTTDGAGVHRPPQSGGSTQGQSGNTATPVYENQRRPTDNLPRRPYVHGNAERGTNMDRYPPADQRDIVARPPREVTTPAHQTMV